MPKYVSCRTAAKCINFIDGHCHIAKHFDYTLRKCICQYRTRPFPSRSTRRAILEIKIDAVERFAKGLVFGEAGCYPGGDPFVLLGCRKARTDAADHLASTATGSPPFIWMKPRAVIAA